MKAAGINNIIKIILIVLVLLFVVYIWPTPYRYISGGYPWYKKYRVDSSSKIPFRINRITGKGEVWYRGGWEETE